MRRLHAATKTQTFKAVKELDAFPKVPESYQETSASGGGFSILTFVIIAILVVSEIRYYTSTELKFDYKVDADFDKKMKINIDMVIAMKCAQIGADVLDVTNQDTYSFGKLEMDPTYFELSRNQRFYFDSHREINRYLRDEYHAIHELLWVSGYEHSGMELPPREDQPTTDPDACRVHGTLEVNKVAGNYHITAGKSIPVIPIGHAHLSMMLSEKDYNFSHRIIHFSFGDHVAGQVNPLDGEELITKNNFHLFQYFIKIVPTEVNTYAHSNVHTYQYAVTERNRSIDHSSGSHGVPGIFMKYDLSSLKIRVSEEHRPYWQFLVRLCGIIGGVFSVSGMLHGVMGFLVDLFCCRFKSSPNKLEQSPPPISLPLYSDATPPPGTPTTPTFVENPGSIFQENILTNANVPVMENISLVGDGS